MREIAEFRAWKRWACQEGRCQGTTRKGEQCKNLSMVIGFEVVVEDDYHDIEFVPGETDRCRVHCRKPAERRP